VPAQNLKNRSYFPKLPIEKRTCATTSKGVLETAKLAAFKTAIDSEACSSDAFVTVAVT
jgi:hypothetical protein